MAPDSSTSAEAGPDLEALRACLEPVAARGSTVTYQEVAQALALQPPRTIHRVTKALERLMEADAEAGRPLLAAVVVSRTREGLPAPGFFAMASRLGRYAGPERGEEAAAFHARELAAVHRAYTGTQSDGG